MGNIHVLSFAVANLIAAGVNGIQFHPVALNRVYKAVTID